ncbi:MAG: AAA family ATPase [Verrucomicrobia bacterium]|nr:AAA family ATPase [Verrucomicrobiota bacterium]
MPAIRRKSAHARSRTDAREEPPPRPIESLSGLIERVTFFNEENGFAVLKVKAKGHRDQVTVVGSLPSVSAGEWVTAKGRWVQDKEFGLQFRANMLNSTAPTTKEGIEKYLGSGMVKGIGPVYAKKLVGKFGERIFDIIEQESARLEDVVGIGPKRRQRIKEAWAEQKVIRKIMVFLHSNGVSTSRAVRIYKTYGEGAIEKVQLDPYCLAKDIHGIGFKTADQIAQKIGIPHDSIIRACAGLDHVLLEATGNGHCAQPVELLRDEAGKLLLVDEKIVNAALEKTLAGGDLVRETIADQELIFLPSLKRAEEGIAARIKFLAAAPPNYPPIDVDKAVAWCQVKAGKVLAPSQLAALRQALSSRALIITGGPGVGKTTLVNAILLILRAKKVRCLLCAPTGRAAKRLSDNPLQLFQCGLGLTLQAVVVTSHSANYRFLGRQEVVIQQIQDADRFQYLNVQWFVSRVAFDHRLNEIPMTAVAVNGQLVPEIGSDVIEEIMQPVCFGIVETAFAERLQPKRLI